MTRALQEALKMLALIPLIGGILGAGCVVFWQAWMYLKHGAWPPVGVTDLFVLAFDSPWARDPDSWLGLHRILEWFPGSVGVLLAGLFGFAILMSAGGEEFGGS